MPAAAVHPAPLSPGVPAWMRRLARHRGLILPVAFILLLTVVLVPVPPAVMDLLICLNISIAVVVLLTTISMDKPLDFSVFPSMLLATTLLRLVLNIASTRLILTAEGSTPEQAVHAAGHVISAFGNFVAGDSLFVGVVIFLILVVVQFVVVTKGATRISEVAARFTLDAMPGKQMAIDADLNAGNIDEAEARRRREEVRQEADFFGAMDGASKFVRGDAVAGIIITAVNILGGFGVGVVERGWPAAQTAEVFTKLTIGDGLAAQLPAFIISIASALIVTRSGSRAQLGDEFADQLVSQPRGLMITAAFLSALSVTGLPMVPLLAGAAALGGLAWALTRVQRRAKDAAARGATAPAAPPPAPESFLRVDALELEVGYALVSLVDPKQGGDLLDRIAALRNQLAGELGLVMPPVRIRDNMLLGPEEYRLKIRDAVVAKGALRPGKVLAMDSGVASGPIQGEATSEPAFGLPAWWVEPALAGRAESLNYTVVEPTRVVTTHVGEVVKRHAHELLTREEVNNLIAGLKERAPRLVEETVPAVVKPVELQRILQNLLRERVPIRDLEAVLETVSEWGPKTKDLDILTEYVRHALRRTICQQVAVPSDRGGLRLVCVTLDPALDDGIAAYIERGAAGTSVAMPARVAAQFAGQITRALEQVTGAGHQPVVVCSPQVRAAVRQIVEPHLPGVTVLGYNEVESGVEVESLALVMPPAQGAAAAA